LRLRKFQRKPPPHIALFHVSVKLIIVIHVYTGYCDLFFSPWTIKSRIAMVRAKSQIARSPDCNIVTASHFRAVRASLWKGSDSNFTWSVFTVVRFASQKNHYPWLGRCCGSTNESHFLMRD
jgi:hypothetical protein